MKTLREKFERNMETNQLICNLLTYFLGLPPIIVTYDGKEASDEIRMSISNGFVSQLNLSFWDDFNENLEDSNLLLFKMCYVVGKNYAKKLDISCNSIHYKDNCEIYNKNCDLCKNYYENVMATAFAKYMCKQVFNSYPSEERCLHAYRKDIQFDEKDMEEIIHEKFKRNIRVPYLTIWIKEMFDFAIYS